MNLLLDLVQRLPHRLRTTLYVTWAISVVVLGLLEWFGLHSIGAVTIDKLQQGDNYIGGAFALVAAGNTPVARRRHDPDVAPLQD